MSIFDGLSKKIGIDLGTANTLVYMKGKGIVIDEPSVVAIQRSTSKVIAIGTDAKEMLDRTPEDIFTVRPLKDGVIADFSITQVMLKYFIKKAVKTFQLIKPVVVIGIPSKVTAVEKRAVEDAAEAAGAKKAMLIEEPVAAAIGAGLDIYEPFGNMVIDIGGGTTDTAVISLGGIVNSESLKLGGDAIDEAIKTYIRFKHNMLIGFRTSEQIKIVLGNVIDGAIHEDDGVMDVTGRDLITGLPKTVNVTEVQVREAIKEPVEAIVASIKRVLEVTPPELAADISINGITMTGGGALLKGLDKLITKETGIDVTISEEPLGCVARGTGVVVENLMKYKSIY
jgi:rod shape-determining protein MreB